MPDPLLTINRRATPQHEQADERQVVNNAGGYTFTVQPIDRLRRFLTLGTTGGTYYVGQDTLTKQNADALIDLIIADPAKVVGEIVEISTAGRAPKQNPALFALAATASLANDAGRKMALGALPTVARTGTHLFQFVRYAEQFRGWGRGLRSAVAGWYETKDADALAYQMVKYQQREGWSHRDLLRLAHPAATSDAHRALYDWACGREVDPPRLPDVVSAARQVHVPGEDIPALIRAGHALSWEMLPSEALNDRAVWEALLDNGIPQTALLRQLPRLTRLGLCDPLGSPYAGKIAAQLSDPDRLRKARGHPINILIAARTYASGQSAMGSGTWDPSALIVDALDAAFYGAFAAVEPTGKRTLLALDVSGSMGTAISGLPITCREATAALALVLANTELSHQVVGFTASGSRGGWGYTRDAAITELPISPRQRLDDAIRTVSSLPFGGTDCSLPMTWALEQGKQVDTFVVLTDSETWAGAMHPHQALRRYREKTGIPARLVVVGMTATNFTIADPSDLLMLDVAGFDAAIPNLISDFSRGTI